MIIYLVDSNSNIIKSFTSKHACYRYLINTLYIGNLRLYITDSSLKIKHAVDFCDSYSKLIDIRQARFNNRIKSNIEIDIPR